MRDIKHIIKCPHCGAEYLPSEIFFPHDFLPNVKDVVKDDSGHIISYRENILNLREEYICDVCGHRFSIDATLSFTASKCDEHDFNNDYATSLFDRERVELKED